MLEFLATLPPIQSSIKAGGMEGDSARVQLDCLLTPEQLGQLVALRGKELAVTIRVTQV